MESENTPSAVNTEGDLIATPSTKSTESAPAPRKSKRTKLILICVAIVAVIIAAVVTIVVIANNKKEEPDDTVQQVTNAVLESRALAVNTEVKNKAEAYKKEHGSYPKSLADFIEDASYLEEFKTAYDSDGKTFKITYVFSGETKTIEND